MSENERKKIFASERALLLIFYCYTICVLVLVLVYMHAACHFTYTLLYTQQRAETVKFLRINRIEDIKVSLMELYCKEEHVYMCVYVCVYHILLMLS